jgi:hypothetical protein
LFIINELFIKEIIFKEGNVSMSVKYVVGKDGLVQRVEIIPPNSNKNIDIKEETDNGAIRDGRRENGTA